MTPNEEVSREKKDCMKILSKDTFVFSFDFIACVILETTLFAAAKFHFSVLSNFKHPVLQTMMLNMCFGSLTLNMLD